MRKAPPCVTCKKALKARPGDKDTQEYINDCRRRLSLPRFEKNFRERTQEAWAAFSQIEAELRQIIDTDETHQRGEELVEKCGNALKTALRDTSFELGFNGEKYELILSPEAFAPACSRWCTSRSRPQNRCLSIGISG